MNLCKVLPIVFFLAGISLFLGGYFGLKKLPELQRSKVNERLPFTKDAESTKKWSQSTDKGYLKIYLFNITNMDEYLNEEDKLIQVKEVGPIVYSYRPNITILNWTETENLITFTKTRTFHFEPTMTKIDLNTKINSVNVVAASVVDKLAGMGYLKQLLGKPKVEKIFQNYNTSIFFTRTVDELLFGGYNISFLIKLDKEKITKFPDQLYGLMHNKNFTYDGIWTTHTGKDNITKLGSANRWNGVSLNTCWSDDTETCGHIIGTDGSRFRPNLDTTGVDHKVNMYSSSLYRPLSMIHRQDYTFKGIKVARYEVEEQNFKLSLEHNRCYCPDKEKTIEGIQMCKFDGLLDISGCREAPIIISAPHFLYGSPELLKYFEGVHPNRSKHESYIDIDPVTGIAMKGRKRLQINVYAREWTNQFGHKTKDTLVPVMWIEEGQEITDEKAVLYYEAIYGLMDKVSLALIGCISIGALLIILAIIIITINTIKSKVLVHMERKRSDINHNLVYHKSSPIDEKVMITSVEK